MVKAQRNDAHLALLGTGVAALLLASVIGTATPATARTVDSAKAEGLVVERSDGNLVYALASYNAGPGNCDKWRTRLPKADLEVFVEAIPFSETRNYVKLVLGNYAAYHSLYPPAQ